MLFAETVPVRMEAVSKCSAKTLGERCYKEKTRRKTDAAQDSLEGCGEASTTCPRHKKQRSAQTFGLGVCSFSTASSTNTGTLKTFKLSSWPCKFMQVSSKTHTVVNTHSFASCSLLVSTREMLWLRAEVAKDLGPDPGTRSPAQAPSATVALWLVGGLSRGETEESWS